MCARLFTALLLSFVLSFSAQSANLLQMEIGESHFLPFDQLEINTPESVGIDKADLPYFEISEIEVTRVETDPSIIEFYEEMNQRLEVKSLGGIITIADRLVALGERVWRIISDQRPVLDPDYMKPISVLPLTADGPQDAFHLMSSWSLPEIKTFEVVYRNGFNASVISFDYHVAYQHSGQFEDRGSYLTGVYVSSSNVSVSWGFELSAESQLVAISNRGSMEDPVAGATLKIDYQAGSVLRTIRTSESFHVTGEGEVIHLR